MALADTLVRMALEADGWSYGDTATIHDYLRICYPGDRPQDALQMAREQSSCMLFLRGLLAHQRRADGSPEIDGVVDGVDLLGGPYARRVGLVEADLRRLAARRGWLRDLLWQGDKTASGTDLPPALPPGLLVVIGQGGSPPTDARDRARWEAEWGGVAHGLLVTGRHVDLVESVDAGQTDPRNANRPTAIRRRERRLERRATGWWLTNAGGARRLSYGIWPEGRS